MKEQIQIKTGANISSLLQSTVNISQAFTELVKNSIQNLATQIDIVISKETVTVTDNGRGFYHVPDSSGKNDFDRYFVFGNSYDNTSGEGVRLGHMGIGGKLANDKLSDTQIDWSIITKNKNSKSFQVNYVPTKTEFLDDYSPVVEEIAYDDSHFPHLTGTKIVINKLNQRIVNYTEAEIGWAKKEIRSFFGLLVKNSKERNKEIRISLNGEDLSFDYDLPGSAFIRKTIEVSHEKGSSSVGLNIFKLNNRSELKDLPVTGVEIAAGVKICNLKLDNVEIVDEIYSEISKLEGKTVEPEASVIHFFNQLIGFVVCDDLGSLLDETGMPAKDLSHHALREDHFLVIPFYKEVYKEIILAIRKYLGVDENSRRKSFNDIAKEILSLIDEEADIDIEEISENETDTTAHSKIQDEEEDEDEEDEDEEDEDEEGEDEDGQSLDSFEAEEEEKEEDYIDPEKIPEDMPEYIDPRILPKELFLELDDENDPDVPDVTVEDITKKGNIIYDIVNFGESYEYEMSSHHLYGKLIIMINSGNHKFKKVEDSENKYAMASYIAECMVKEIELYNSPESQMREVEYKISEFYHDHGNKIKLRFIND